MSITELGIKDSLDSIYQKPKSYLCFHLHSRNIHLASTVYPALIDIIDTLVHIFTSIQFMFKTLTILYLKL